jgi:hypothetical protein
MNTPVALISRVTTEANRVAPLASFHVTRAGSVSGRRFARLGAAAFVVLMVDMLDTFI